MKQTNQQTKQPTNSAMPVQPVSAPILSSTTASPAVGNIYPNDTVFKSSSSSQTKTSAASNNPYLSQPQPDSVRKPDTVQTKRMKEHFPFFGIGSLLYAIFYTFCLYRNASGITYPFFVAGTLCYFFFSMQKLGIPYKKRSSFYLISMVMLGISNCLTSSAQLLILNKCGIFLLAFILILHTMYADKDWNLPKYFTAVFQTIGTAFSCCLRPFTDMGSYFDAQKQQKTGKKSYFIPVVIGIVIAIPLLLAVTILLASADAIFSEIFSVLLESINFIMVFRILFMIILVFFSSYAVYAALCIKNVKEEVTDHRAQEPIIAIIVTSTLSVVYLIFSVIQILYLFIGNMQLPEGYTYSSYAREGFFQLLAVCILNLIIVLICLYLFRKNIVLNVILTILSGCTFIMILSSALRMLMYINRYNLTLLRILVLWALAVIFLLMMGVTVLIYRNDFPLFPYGMVVVTLFYICLSFSHPDYWIARYNLNPEHQSYLDSYDIRDNQNYLASLSADAAPILLNEETNYYLKDNNTGILQENYSEESLEEFRKESTEESLAKFPTDSLTESEDFSDTPTDYENLEDRPNWRNKEFDDSDWIRAYYQKIEYLSKHMHIRSFNFSIYNARKYL